MGNNQNVMALFNFFSDMSPASAVKDSRLRRTQTIAFAAFILFCLIDVMFIALKSANVVSPANNTYRVAMCCASILGYVALYPISSNLPSDFFAAGQIMLELFYPLTVPVAMYLGTESIEDYLTMYYVSMLICVLSIYNWSMFLSNSRFSWRQLRWILILPMVAVFNLVQSWNFIGRMEGREQWLHVDFYHNFVCMAILLALILAMPMGYWVLTHSRAFAGDKNELDMPNFSPLNRYFFLYASIAAIGMLMF
ncbi:MAG: hypothetical protein NC102_08775 [Clostridium sp.]|nr:hypothetical protein [Clostridium sp.]